MSDTTVGYISDTTVGNISDMTVGNISDMTVGNISDMTVGNISDTTVGNQPDCLRISSSTSAISPLMHIDLSLISEGAYVFWKFTHAYTALSF